jgi:hypothetical protein
MSNHVTRFPTGFDYAYRPQSYFQGIDPKALIVSSILGEERRKDVQRRLESEDFDPAVWGEWLTDSKLDDHTRKMIGSVHPALMGGEYLPQLGHNEIEIVRIVLASTMQDVISIRARRSGERIAYRVVDEHENEFALPRKSSAQPLSLQQLIAFIDGTNQAEDSQGNGLVYSVLDMNIEGSGDPESLRGFVSVSSVFYPELQRYYDAQTDQHLDRFVVEDDEDEEEDDELVGEPDAPEDQCAQSDGGAP